MSLLNYSLKNPQSFEQWLDSDLIPKLFEILENFGHPVTSCMSQK